jgi:hypothetical protein
MPLSPSLAAQALFEAAEACEQKARAMLQTTAPTRNPTQDNRTSHSLDEIKTAATLYLMAAHKSEDPLFCDTTVQKAADLAQFLTTLPGEGVSQNDVYLRASAFRISACLSIQAIETAQSPSVREQLVAEAAAAARRAAQGGQTAAQMIDRVCDYRQTLAKTGTLAANDALRQRLKIAFLTPFIEPLKKQRTSGAYLELSTLCLSLAQEKTADRDSFITTLLSCASTLCLSNKRLPLGRRDLMTLRNNVVAVDDLLAPLFTAPPAEIVDPMTGDKIRPFETIAEILLALEDMSHDPLYTRAAPLAVAALIAGRQKGLSPACADKIIARIDALNKKIAETKDPSTLKITEGSLDTLSKARSVLLEKKIEATCPACASFRPTVWNLCARLTGLFSRRPAPKQGPEQPMPHVK